MGSAAHGGRPGETDLDPPERLVRTVSAWEGDAGRAWLARLPQQVAHYLDAWRLTPERVFAQGGQISMIVLVGAEDGTSAVLKVGMVTEESALEHAALEQWDGRGAVRLLRSDPEHGALLLERLQADVSLRSLAEPKAMLEAMDLLRRLWVAPQDGHPFRGVADRTAELAATLRERRDEAWAADARPLIDEALELRDALAADAAEPPVLLHGDYHHGNVLAGERMPWLAIDPKPLVGERAYDLAWLARDRLPTLAAKPGSRAAARRRIARLASVLEVPEDRLRGWSVFRAVEAGVWSLSVGDRDDGELLLEFAGWL